ncbi:hypothetical protein MKW92_037226 [Papaver armeniacum]|nr:hypothetical protein MKW92_037226 [Papaver armeniacum]
MVASRYAEKVLWLKKLLGHVDSDTRESAARLLGIACSSLSTPTTSALISELVSSISGVKNLRFENHHGALCAIVLLLQSACQHQSVFQNPCFKIH